MLLGMLGGVRTVVSRVMNRLVSGRRRRGGRIRRARSLGESGDGQSQRHDAGEDKFPHSQRSGSRVETAHPNSAAHQQNAMNRPSGAS
jgi:hypothetical protein